MAPSNSPLDLFLTMACIRGELEPMADSSLRASSANGKPVIFSISRHLSSDTTRGAFSLSRKRAGRLTQLPFPAIISSPKIGMPLVSRLVTRDLVGMRQPRDSLFSIVSVTVSPRSRWRRTASVRSAGAAALPLTTRSAGGRK